MFITMIKCIPVVVNATCIELKDPINTVSIVLMQHALDQSYCLDLSLNKIEKQINISMSVLE